MDSKKRNFIGETIKYRRGSGVLGQFFLLNVSLPLYSISLSYNDMEKGLRFKNCFRLVLWELTFCRQFKVGNNYYHIFVSNEIIESSFVSNKTSEITSVFPLYFYPEKGHRTIEGKKQKPNDSPGARRKMAQTTQYMTPGDKYSL
jgi:hypothetical protein